MTAGQLYDSLQRVHMRNQRTGSPRSSAEWRGRRLFLSKMHMRGAMPSEFEAGMIHALTILNGMETAAATSVGESGLLTALGAPFFTDEQRVETLFLATLSRRPRDEERATFVEYIKGREPNRSSPQALSDVLWALLNSAEFMLNH